MAETIMEDVDRKAAMLLRLAQQLAEVRRWRQQQLLASEGETLRAEQYRLRMLTQMAQPFLSEGMRDQWWASAQVEDAAHMLGVAERFADVDPLAHQVQLRARREIRDRWSVDVTAADWQAALEASDDDLNAVCPTVGTESVPSPAELRADALATQVTASNRAEIIESLESNGSLPAHVRDGLIARMQQSSGAMQSADAALARSEADHSHAVREQGELVARSQSGDERAGEELVRADATERTASAAVTRARGDAEQMHHEASVGETLREESFPVPAEEALGRKSAARAQRRPVRKAVRSRRRIR